MYLVYCTELYLEVRLHSGVEDFQIHFDADRIPSMGQIDLFTNDTYSG